MRTAVVYLLLLAASCAPPHAAPPPAPSAPAAVSPRVAAAAAPEVAAPEPLSPAPSSAPSAEASAPAPPPAGTPLPPIPRNTSVLHIGDSFALAGFAQALKPRMKALGVRYEVRAETSSYTTSWAGKMELIVQNTQPDLVIINLGANEVANTDPPAHAYAVRNIVKAIGGRPCVWVSPPLWRKDTGMIDVIRTNSAPCRFFDSDRLVTQPIPRQPDRIHPSEKGGAIWAEAFWDWLESERTDPVLVPLPKQLNPKTPVRRSPWALKPSPPAEHAPFAAP